MTAFMLPASTPLTHHAREIERGAEMAVRCVAGGEGQGGKHFESNQAGLACLVLADVPSGGTAARLCPWDRLKHVGSPLIWHRSDRHSPLGWSSVAADATPKPSRIARERPLTAREESGPYCLQGAIGWKM